MTLLDVVRVFEGSDGDATRALFALLVAKGPAGELAMNLFRTQKASSRAKVYRGRAPGRGSFKGIAYDKKQWAMDQITGLLASHADSLGIRWGWGQDLTQEFYPWVLYIDLPTGQASFHTRGRGEGPDYRWRWDGVADASPGRICRYCVDVLAGNADFYCEKDTRERARRPCQQQCNRCAISVAHANVSAELA